MITRQFLPPPLIHALRARSFSRLFNMTGNPGNRGFGRYVRRRIRDVVRREKMLVEKAISVAYMGSYLVDHIIFAEKQACEILEGRSLTEREEHALWERNYAEVIAQLASEQPEGERLLEEIERVWRYTALAPSLDRARSRHWGSLKAVLEGSLADLSGKMSEIPLVTRIHDVLASPRPAAVKARAVCLSASLLADMHCWNTHVDWRNAYEKVMTELYPLVVRHPDVLEEIVGLS
jgi:hypothetical protein